jgi:hypothetical protein
LQFDPAAKKPPGFCMDGFDFRYTYNQKEAAVINRHRFNPNMEASPELHPCVDETPGSRAHYHRCARPVSRPAGNVKMGEKESTEERKRENGQ